MKHLGYIADADGILLWFPNQNRTFSVPKPYGFGTENVKGDCLKQISIPFDKTLIHGLINKLSN